MISGIAEELIQLATRYAFDNLPEAWKKEKKKSTESGRYASFYSPTIFAMALDEYLLENQVDIILDCMAVYPIMQEKKCTAIVAETKEGKVLYEAKMVIDATGDASIFAQAGLPTVDGQNYMTYIAHGYDQSDIQEYLSGKSVSMLSLRKWRKAGSDFYGVGHPDGMRRVAGVTAEEITEYVLVGRKLLFDKLKKQDKQVRDISMLPFMPQLRTIRHIIGQYSFRAIDKEYYLDSIGSCGDFRPDGKGKHYHIPFRALYNDSCRNLLAAGRIIDVDENGWEIARVIPVCALTGQAAGAAAALCVKGKQDLDKLDVMQLQAILKKQNVLFVR